MLVQIFSSNGYFTSAKLVDTVAEVNEFINSASFMVDTDAKPLPDGTLPLIRLDNRATVDGTEISWAPDSPWGGF